MTIRDKTSSPTLFTDFLNALGVPYTTEYSQQQYADMAFRSLYGLAHLLGEYGVETQGLMIENKEEFSSLPTPFLAQTRMGSIIIVTGINTARASYLSEGVPEQIATHELSQGCTGVVLLARPQMFACEPNYAAHRQRKLMYSLRNYGMVIISLALLATLVITQYLWQNLSTLLIIAFDLIGISLSTMLIAKGLGIHSRIISNVCGIVQREGCDTVLADKASKFFGIFKWSEVGMAYFSISLLALLIWPSQTLPYLALCNVCCLPFSVWSVWYQKRRAKAWCTLCLSVQGCLWALFFCYLGGGWYAMLAQFQIMPLLLLGASYILALLVINTFNGWLHASLNTEPDNE